MIKRSKLSKKVIIGAIVGSLAISGTALGAVKAYEKSIKARFAGIGLIVNGKLIQTKAEPFIYNGNVYAPVATVANGLGVNQRWSNTDWVNNYKPSVRFDGYNVKDLNRNIHAGLSLEGGGKAAPDRIEHYPLSGQLFMEESFYFESNYLSLMDYSTSIPKRINIPHISQQPNYQKLIPGSVELIDTNPNNVRFMVYEDNSMWKDNKVTPMIQTVEYKDNKLTMGNPIPFENNTNVLIRSVAKAGNTLFVQSYDSNRKSVGTQTYTIENGKLSKLEAVTK